MRPGSIIAALPGVVAVGYHVDGPVPVVDCRIGGSRTHAILVVLQHTVHRAMYCAEHEGIALCLLSADPDDLKQ